MKTLKKITSWYFTREALPYWTILLIDCMFVVASGFMAYTVNHGVERVSEAFMPLVLTLGAFLICFLIGFWIFHTYAGVIRFSSFSDLTRATLAVVVAIALVFILQWLSGPNDWLLTFSTADVLMLGLMTIAFLWISRVWVKTIYEGYIHGNSRKKVFIYGVKAGGVALAKNINSSSDTPYALAGFVSDEPDMMNRRLMNVHVFPFNSALPQQMERKGVKILIVSPLKMNELRQNSDVVDLLAESGIKILVMPHAKTWDGKSDISLSDLQPIDVEDLLPREKIDVDMKAAERLLAGHTVMITGAAGSIGSEMVRQIARYNPACLVLVDQAETPMHDIRLMMRDEWPDIKAFTIVANISDNVMMERLFRQFKPEYVFHAAAYKHVPMMEDNPYESIINNVYGTKILADLAVKYGTRKFVMVSTDKAVNPTNVMGCSKRICEIYVQSLDKALKDAGGGKTQFVTTRFGNVLGSNGSVIPLFEKQIKQGGPVTVTHPDIIRFFMLIPEACKLVIEAGTMGNGGEIYVFDMGEPVKIADLARRMIRLSDARNIEIKFTGLRDGEKLYEEVLNDKEVTLPTFHPKIKVAKVREYDFATVDSKITALISGCDSMDDMQIVAHMKEIVPEFKSKNSIYEQLD